MQIAQRYMKNTHHHLLVRKYKSKSTEISPHTGENEPHLKNKQTKTETSAGEDLEKQEYSYTAGGNLN